MGTLLGVKGRDAQGLWSRASQGGLDLELA